MARGAAYAASAVAVVILCYVAWNARLLRPIADDYCAGQHALKGFFGSISSWYDTWSGDVSARAIDFVLVGWPVVHLPWSLASSLPFLVTAAGVSAAMLAVVWRTAPAVGAWRNPGLLLMFPSGVLAWWGFWWMPVRLPGPFPNDPQAANLAQGITVWNIVNTSYALVPALLVLVLAAVTRSWRRGWLGAAVSLTVGVFFGLGGFVLAATALAAVLAILVLETLLRRHWLPSRLLAAAFAVGLGLGMAISYTAPGTRIRSDLLKQNPALSPLTFHTLLSWVFPQGFVDWGLGVATMGTLLVVCLMAGAAFVVCKAGLRFDARLLTLLATVLLVGSLGLSLVNRASEAVAYVAFWHQVSTRALIFIAVGLLSIALGERLAATAAPVSWTFVLVLAVGLVGTTMATSPMVGTIKDRFERWQVGPAPMPAITDIDDPAGWEMACWSSVAKARDDAPPRSGG